MAPAPAMDLHHRRLSVCKSSSSKISKSSPLRPFTSRPPATVVNADLTNFRQVVQQLTGTPPPSVPSSPVHDLPNPSRLQRIAPPRLRQLQHPQAQQNHQHFLPQHQPSYNQANSDHASIHQQHHNQYMKQEIISAPNNIKPQCNPPWQPPLPPPPHPNPYLPMLSPHLLSPLPALTPGDNTWASTLDAINSPRLVSNCAKALSSRSAENTASEWSMSTAQCLSSGHLNSHPHPSSHFSNSHGFLPASNRNLRLSPSSNARFWWSPTSNEQPLLPPSLNELIPSSEGLPLTSNRHPLSLPPYAHPLPPPFSPHVHPLPPLPNSPAALPPLSYPVSHSLPLSPPSSFSWLPPWPMSPFQLSPLPFSPGLFPPSPGIAPFIISSPTGFSFQAPNYERSSKPP